MIEKQTLGDASERTSPEDITAAVVASIEACPEPRLRQVAEALARHLHAFVRKVGVTQAEWEAAIRILTETGHITDEQRQEFIL
jgi:hydroxyquinol 1,2-dioxygenase